jgi:hypothetical protein
VQRVPHRASSSVIEPQLSTLATIGGLFDFFGVWGLV